MNLYYLALKLSQNRETCTSVILSVSEESRIFYPYEGRDPSAIASG